ncbi:MAG TPA: SDR family oxidoreductase [Verrucomicrobiae bacterium]|nr:SDR family oxidoreductase [Verrucomicrobiae bacterium]
MALVTGAGKRLGRAIALRLAQEGADVAVHYGKSASDARAVVEQIENLGRRAAAFPAELTDVAGIEHLVNQVISQFGQLDILINTAATFLQTKFGETTEAIWHGSLDTNLKAPFFLSQAAAPYLTKAADGVIINFADIGGLLGWRDFLPHSLSKAGVMMLTRILAKELAPAVRVNAIAPGTITMPGDPPEWQADYIRLAPLRRTGSPDEITDAVLYLITAEFVTGHVLVLDGGRTL